MKNTKKNLPGLLLYLERVRQNKTQKEVCFGLCVVSYLSKIEHGTAEADPELQQKLFQRLGIRSETDEAVLEQGQAQIETCYRDLLYHAPEWSCDYEELRALGDGLAYSAYALDWHLLRGIYEEEQGHLDEAKQTIVLLKQLEDAMELRQLGFLRYLELCVRNHSENEKLRDDEKTAVELAEEQCRYLDGAFSKCCLAEALLVCGDLPRIHQMEQVVTAQALQEGNLYYLAFFYVIRGTAYAVLDQEALMMDYYKKAEQLLKYTVWKDTLCVVTYNIGATYLTLKKYEESLEYLQRLEQSKEYLENKTDYFSWKHKEALACIRSGRMEEGKEHLKELSECLKSQKNPAYVDVLRYEEANWETKADYLKDPAYLKLLEQLLSVLEEETPFGYWYFYREQIVQACEKQRYYRKALEYERKFSEKIGKKPIKE